MNVNIAYAKRKHRVILTQKSSVGGDADRQRFLLRMQKFIYTMYSNEPKDRANPVQDGHTPQVFDQFHT